MPKGNEIAQAYISIIPEMSGIQGKIAKELDADSIGSKAGSGIGAGMLSGIGSSAGKIAATMAKAAAAGTAAAVAGIGVLTKAAMESYGTYEQLAGGARQIFDEMDFSRISADAQGAYRTMGLSANEYLESINQVGAAFSATMGDERGYDTAKRGMQAISDYASGTGRSLSELNEKYQMITRSTGSYQSIADQFSGILPATSADFLAQAQAAGLLSGEYTKLTEVPVAEYQEAVTAMLERGVDSLGLTGNTAREATQTITGSIDMLKASWANFVTELGKDDADLEARTSELVDGVVAVAENVIPRVGSIVERLVAELPSIVARLAPKLGEAVSDLLDGVTGGAFSKAVEAVTPYLNRMAEAGRGLVDRLAPLAPVAADIGEKIGGLLMRALDAVTGMFETFAPVVASVAEVALPALDDALGFVTEAFDAVMPIVEPIQEFLAGAMVKAVEALGDAFQKLADILGPIFTGIKDGAGAVADFLGDKLGWLGDQLGITSKHAESTVKSSSDNTRATLDAMANGVASSTDSMANGVASSTARMAASADSNTRDAANRVAANTADAASSAESNSARIDTAWNQSYEMGLYATADTWDAESALSDVYNRWNGTTITFYSSFSGGGGGGFGGDGGGGAFAAGAIIQKHADGFIVDRPGRGVDITRHIAGEAGGEAIIPLTNKQYVAPFAKTVADFISPELAGVTVTGNTFVVRKDGDIRQIAIEINRQSRREGRSRL